MLQFNLFGGTVLKLGTERHHAKLLPGIDSLDDIGCFGLTELGYGNNAVEMETTATYDEASGSCASSFCTPDNSSRTLIIIVVVVLHLLFIDRTVVRTLVFSAKFIRKVYDMLLRGVYLYCKYCLTSK